MPSRAVHAPRNGSGGQQKAVCQGRSPEHTALLMPNSVIVGGIQPL